MSDRVIALSGKQFSGKDVLADYLVSVLPGIIKLPLARAIKLEFANLYGLTPPEIEDNKALYRPGLIALGQRRREHDQNYWLRRVLETPGDKIISDMRLQREHDVLKMHGAILIRVEADREIRVQRGTLVMEDDATECELDNVTDWTAVLENNGDLATFQKSADKLLKRLGLLP